MPKDCDDGWLITSILWRTMSSHWGIFHIDDVSDVGSSPVFMWLVVITLTDSVLCFYFNISADRWGRLSGLPNTMLLTITINTCQQRQLPKRHINQIYLTHKDHVQHNIDVTTFLNLRLNVAYSSKRMGLYNVNENSYIRARTE